MLNRRRASVVDLTFFEKRSSNLLLYIIIIAIVLLLLYMVWPWKTALILTLWAAYVLWWPTVWLEKYIHRRGLAALIVIIVTGVLMAFALVNVTVIVAQQIAEIAAGASASSNATLSQGITNTFQLANPDLAKTGPVLALVSALATGGGIITTTFTQGAHGIVRNVLISIPLLLAQLIIVFFLLLGILAKGDVIVKDFVGAVPAKHRSIVNRFLKHLNPIYYTFFVIYVAVAVVCAILAAIIYGILGVPFFATFAVFILFIGLIPSVGRALIYIPLTIWLLIQGQTVTALLVLITSIVVFELILRYTIQPRWMERTGKVPKTLTLIAFTFALAAFGFIGFAIGPAIVGFALAMWRTYKDIQREQEEQAPAIAQASGS